MKKYKTIEFYDEYDNYEGCIRIKIPIEHSVLFNKVWFLCVREKWLDNVEEGDK